MKPTVTDYGFDIVSKGAGSHFINICPNASILFTVGLSTMSTIFDDIHLTPSVSNKSHKSNLIKILFIRLSQK